MLNDDELRRLLPKLPTRAVHGPWYRIVDYAALQNPPPGAPPGTGVQPLWPGGGRRDGRRFTPRGGFDALYLAGDPLTALAETYRAFVVPGGPLFSTQNAPGVLLTVNGVITDALDLTDPDIQDALATSTSELTGAWALPGTDREPPTQRLGRIAYKCGVIHALRYVSAKNSLAGANLVVFTDRFGCGNACQLEVFDPYGQLQQRFA